MVNCGLSASFRSGQVMCLLCWLLVKRCANILLYRWFARHQIPHGVDMQRACRTFAHADFGTGQQCWQSKSGEQLQTYSCRLFMAPGLTNCGALVCSFRCVMQLQDAQMTYAALANHRQPHLDCLAYLSQLVLYQVNVSKLPLLALIYHNLPDVLPRPLHGNEQAKLL